MDTAGELRRDPGVGFAARAEHLRQLAPLAIPGLAGGDAGAPHLIAFAILPFALDGFD
jgi:hypothetical protein